MPLNAPQWELRHHNVSYHFYSHYSHYSLYSMSIPLKPHIPSIISGSRRNSG